MRHTETQAVRLARSVVRVLAQDHYAYLVERGALEGIENVPSFRVCGMLGALGQEKGFQFREVGRTELDGEALVPSRTNIRAGACVVLLSGGHPVRKIDDPIVETF